MLTRFHISTLAIVVAVVTGEALQTPPPARQWPPAVEKISASAPVFSPAEALATFSMPSGYRLELVASEPLIQDPVAIDWDGSGRLWAIELPGYMRDMMSTGEYDATGRIVVLEDKNDDGSMDTRTVFADGLIQPRALKVLDRGALVGEPPNVWLLKDSDRDLRVDGKELVATGYGRRETNVEVNANGLYWALDNRIYAAGIGVDMYLRWQGGPDRDTEVAVTRSVGPDSRRRGTHLPEPQRVGAARRFDPDAVLCSQSEPAAHTRQPRNPHRRRR